MPPGICFQWAKDGTCKFGNRCKFQHAGRNTKPSVTSSFAAAPTPPNDIQRFVTALKNLNASRLEQHLQSSIDLWQQAWIHHATLTDQNLLLLVESLAKIPCSSALSPPPILRCKDAAEVLLRRTKVQASAEKLLRVVEIMCNSVERLLQFEWDEDKEHVQYQIIQILVTSEAVLDKSIREHREVAQKVLSLIEDVEKPWRVIQKKCALRLEEPLDTSHELKIEDLRDATVSWLSNAKFFTPSNLPIMKVPQSRHDGVYDSFDDYITTIQKLWIGMTFSDGFASLSPKCRCRKGKSDQVCQQAMWPIASKDSLHPHMKCRTRNCSGFVEYACRIRSHEGLCGRCAETAQINNRSSPGPKASTHVYDGTIDRVDSDGRIFVKSFISRNPPQHQIHWRSTKRLSSPSLVGVIKLKAPGTTLKGSDQLIWGEISLHGHPRDEAQMRERGLLLINLSTIVEINLDLFAPGDNVAIVDCMTFVPEWIPVLKAVEQQKEEASPPFDRNGSYLNLCSAHPANVSNSVMHGSDPEKLKLDNVESLIQDMIEHSMLDPICQIRRDEQRKSELLRQLSSLVKETTLDRMQLISFVDSIRNPVHLTQGKSNVLLTNYEHSHQLTY